MQLWWRIAQSVSKFKSTNTTNTPIKVNGDIFFHPVDKANSINNYFTSVSNIDSEPDLPDVPPLAHCELSGIVINEQEVCDQFQILNISKSGGPDNLPPKFLKAVFQSLIKIKLSNSMKLFADDTSLYCIVDDQNETAESLNSDLNSLSTWASDWCVNFNASKTKPMLFT